LIILFPILLILTAIGAIAMKGNPFFTQARPGKISKKTGKERIFKLVKFRTMSNAKDKEGNLLPDDVRLNGYGKFLRPPPWTSFPSF
jgi:lipopolysaccharide/colanic/teichoic acid biosynthesis glycosyltransferase